MGNTFLHFKSQCDLSVPYLGFMTARFSKYNLYVSDHMRTYMYVISHIHTNTFTNTLHFKNMPIKFKDSFNIIFIWALDILNICKFGGWVEKIIESQCQTPHHPKVIISHLIYAVFSNVVLSKCDSHTI